MCREYKLDCRNQCWQLLSSLLCFNGNFINFTDDKMLKFYHCRSPPRSATLTWWWGSAPMTRKISKIWRQGATKSWPNLCRQIATRYQCFCAGFGFTADYGFIAVYLRLFLRLHSRYGFMAATCNLLVTFGDTHWAELIWPQRWACVWACPPRR